MAQPYPAPPATEDSRPYWDSVRDGEWRMQRCVACGVVRFPPGAVCRSCGSPEFFWEPAPQTGVVVARTVVHRAPDAAFAARVPYTLAIVELAPGVRLVAPVTGGEVAVGARVTLGREPAADDMWLPVFTTTDDGEAR